jgi:hypothetical protein
LIFRLAATGVIIAGLIALLVLLLPSSGEEGRPAYFEGVDCADKTPVLFRYKFQPGQRLVFECSAEIVTRVHGHEGAGGIQRIETEHVFDVTSVDNRGSASMNVTTRKLVLETAAGFGQRRVEMTPESVHVFSDGKETKPEEEDLQAQKSFAWQSSVKVDSRGTILSEGAAKGGANAIRQLNMFLTCFFPELPEAEIVPGERYAAKPAPQDEVPIVKRNEKREFLGYKEYDGQRCAVLKTSLSFQTAPIPGKGTRNVSPLESRKGKSVTGIFFSPERGLSPLTFMRVESDWKIESSDPTMRGSTREEFTIKLVSVSISKK